MAIIGAHFLYVYETVYTISYTYKPLQISERLDGAERTTVTESKEKFDKKCRVSVFFEDFIQL